MSNIRKILNNGKKVELPIWNGKTPYALYYNGECVWKNDEVSGDFITVWNIELNTFVFPKLENVAHIGKIYWGDGKSEDYDSSLSYTHIYKNIGYYTITIDCEVTTLIYQAFYNRQDLISFKCPTAYDFEEKIFYGCKNVESVVISDRAEYLSFLMFAACRKIESFDFANIKKIEKRAFVSSGLSGKINLNVECLETGAFLYCSNITDIFISDNIKEIVYDYNDSELLYSDQLGGTSNLQKIYIGKDYVELKNIPPGFCYGLYNKDIDTYYSSLLYVEIAEGVENIGGESDTSEPAFYMGGVGYFGCSVHLPSTIKYLGHHCFYLQSYNALFPGNNRMEIYYKGSKEQWLGIKKHEEAFNVFGNGVNTILVRCWNGFDFTGVTFTIRNDGTVLNN